MKIDPVVQALSLDRQNLAACCQNAALRIKNAQHITDSLTISEPGQGHRCLGLLCRLLQRQKSFIQRGFGCQGRLDFSQGSKHGAGIGLKSLLRSGPSQIYPFPQAPGLKHGLKKISGQAPDRKVSVQ